MAGDWIPFDKSLPRKLETIAIAGRTGLSRREVVGLLLEFWAWADEQTEDGILRPMSVRNLSALFADMGETFFGAMADVGWIREDGDAVVLANFGNWMGTSAKRRIKDSRRKRMKRADGHPKPVRKMSASHADETRTTVEESREEKKNTPPTPPGGGLPPIPDSLNTPRFLDLWERWKKHRSEKKVRLTPTAAAQQLKKLSAMGLERAIAAVEHSLSQGYTGVFEPGGTGSGGAARRPKETPAEMFARFRAEEDAKRCNGKSTSNGQTPTPPDMASLPRVT